MVTIFFDKINFQLYVEKKKKRKEREAKKRQKERGRW